jgi:hypothetical protein
MVFLPNTFQNRSNALSTLLKFFRSGGAIMVDSCFADAGSFGKEKSAFFLQWRSISFDSRVLMGAF